MKFYEDKLYKVNTQGHLESESMLPSESQDDMSTCSDASVDCDNEGMSCKRATEYENSVKATPVTSTPVKSQLVIISNKEMPLLSDELEMLDVGVEMPLNPFVGMDINEILIEIVDNLNDESGFETPNRVMKCTSVYVPLTDEDRRAVGLKFNLVLSVQTHKVNHFGIGEKLANPPIPPL